MKLEDRVPCPVCNFLTGMAHCNNSKCDWHVCTRCAKSVRSVLIFVGDRYFIAPRS